MKIGELAQEHLEHARHHAAAHAGAQDGATAQAGAAHADAAHGGAHEVAHGVDAETKWGAILVAVLASLAVIVEMGVNDTMIMYLSNHISSSDTWAQYQAKSVRRALYQQSAVTLEAGGEAQKPLAEAARHDAERMQNDPGRDGMEQLSERARVFEEQREHELHLHEGLERGARGLQIGVVLIGLAMATRFRWLLWGGGVLGGVSAVYSLVAGLGLI